MPRPTVYRGRQIFTTFAVQFAACPGKSGTFHFCSIYIHFNVFGLLFGTRQKSLVASFLEHSIMMLYVPALSDDSDAWQPLAASRQLSPGSSRLSFPPPTSPSLPAGWIISPQEQHLYQQQHQQLPPGDSLHVVHNMSGILAFFDKSVYEQSFS